MSERAEELEAMIRYAMADHAAIRPRGFDTIRQRQELHKLIDELLDARADALQNLGDPTNARTER